MNDLLPDEVSSKLRTLLSASEPIFRYALENLDNAERFGVQDAVDGGLADLYVQVRLSDLQVSVIAHSDEWSEPKALFAAVLPGQSDSACYN